MLKPFAILWMALQLVYCQGFSIQPKIVNGFVSNPEHFPYYVNLRIRDDFFGVISICGGTLLSNKWILTAAHCLDGKNSITAYLGIDSSGHFRKSVRIPLENQFVSPEHDTKTDANDIALLRLPHVLKRDKHIRPAKLPVDCGKHLENERAIVIGTGQTSFYFEDLQPDLHHAYLQILPSDECKKVFRHFGAPESVICTNSTDGQSPYRGDSGGPLLRQSDGSVIGVASFVKLKSWHLLRKIPVQIQGFTKVHYFFEWISKVTETKLPKCKRPIYTPPITTNPRSPWSWFRKQKNQ